MKKYQIKMDGRDMTDDWIYFQLAEADYVCNYERIDDCKEIAFYRFGYLWKATWIDDVLGLRVLSNAEDEIMAKMEQTIHDILDHTDRDGVDEIMCDTSRDLRTSIIVTFYAQTYEEGE